MSLIGLPLQSLPGRCPTGSRQRDETGPIRSIIAPSRELLLDKGSQRALRGEAFNQGKNGIKSRNVGQRKHDQSSQVLKPESATCSVSSDFGMEPQTLPNSTRARGGAAIRRR